MQVQSKFQERKYLCWNVCSYEELVSYNSDREYSSQNLQSILSAKFNSLSDHWYASLNINYPIHWRIL